MEVAPSKDELVVQMLWTKFDPTDDPSTFPRVELHVAGDKTPIPVSKATTFALRNQPWIWVKGDCTVGGDKLPAWCHSKAVAQTSIASVVTDAFPQYRIGVKYLDDRYEGSPAWCIRAFRGALASEWWATSSCAPRSWWDVARVDATTGKIPVPPPPPPPPPAPGPRRPLPRQPRRRQRRRLRSSIRTTRESLERRGHRWPRAAASATPAPKASATPTPTPPPKRAATATPAPMPAPSASSTPAKPRQPGDPWKP